MRPTEIDVQRPSLGAMESLMMSRFTPVLKQVSVFSSFPDEACDEALDRDRLRRKPDASLLEPRVKQPRRGIAPDQRRTVARPEPSRTWIGPVRHNAAPHRRCHPLGVQMPRPLIVPDWHRSLSYLNLLLIIVRASNGPDFRPFPGPGNGSMVKCRGCGDPPWALHRRLASRANKAPQALGRLSSAG